MKTPESFKYLVLLVLKLILVSSLKAQPDTPIWKYARTTSPSQISEMLTDSVGNCYISGTFMSDYFRYGKDSVPGNTGETTNSFLMKTDPTGKLLWLYPIYGTVPSASVQIKKITISERGEVAIIFTGEQTDGIQFGDQIIAVDTSNSNTLIAKIAKDRKIAWIYRLIATDYGMNKGQMNAMDLFIEEAGDVYLTGFFLGSYAYLSDQVINGTDAFSMLFVARIEPDGHVAWFRDCPIEIGKSTANICATIISNAPGDRFFIGGYYDGNQGFFFGTDTLKNAGVVDAFIACYTKDGMSQWANAFRGDTIDYAEKIVVMPNGDPVFMGFCNSYNLNIEGALYFNPSGNYNIYLARYIADGNIINSTSLPVEKSYYSGVGRNAYLDRDINENLLICSEFQSSSVFQDVFTLINPQPGTNDLLIAKLNSITFDPQWTFHGTAPGDNNFDGVQIDKRGNVFFSGTSYSDLILDPDIIGGNIMYGNPYTARINTDGTLDYTFWQVNDADNLLHMTAVSSDAYGNAFVAGDFWGLSNALGSTDLISTGIEGSFLAKYSKVKNINGLVTNDEGDPLTDGNVKIFGYTFYQRSPLNDSVRLQSDGTFMFTSVPAGNYLIVARPTGEDAEVYIPTYYPSVEYWEFAEHIRVTSDFDPGIIYITIQRHSEFNGITQMSGNVSEADEGKRFNTTNYWNKGRPTTKATVVLAGNKKPEKSTYQIIATTETDDEGNFAFYGIEDGFYYLWVDIPGLPCEPVYFIEVTGGQYISNLNYLVNEEIAEAEGFQEYNSVNSTCDDSGVLLYPVPARDMVILIIPASENSVTDIFDSHGSHIRRIELNSAANLIDVSELLPGNYILRIYLNDSIIFKKLSIIR